MGAPHGLVGISHGLVRRPHNSKPYGHLLNIPRVEASWAIASWASLMGQLMRPASWDQSREKPLRETFLLVKAS